MNIALKRINARVKVLQKKHPKSKRKSLQKQAGREWKAGKLKAKRKPAPAKKKRAVKRASGRRVKTVRKTVRRKRVKAVKKRVYRAKVVKVKAYKGRRYKRVSGIGKMSSLVPIVAIGGLALLAYMALKPSTPALAYTNNPARAQAQNNVLMWASAAGLAASAIAKLIDTLNNSDDSTVISAGQSPSNAAQLYNPFGEGL